LSDQKPCKPPKKGSRNPNQLQAKVEVKVNSRIFCGLPLDASDTACTIAAHAGPPQSPAKSHSAGLAPERSLTQRMDALQRANEIRTRRAKLKRDLKAGRQQIHGLLLDPPEYVLTAKVFDLLLAVPKYGRVKVNRILTHCRISPSKTIGGLSERQRNELVSYLRR
jgi:hypothetical protein